MPERLTGGAWASKLGVEIVDPDGWRAAGIPFGRLITRDEYNRLAATSTQRPIAPRPPAPPTWDGVSDFYEDDEDPEKIREIMDRAPDTVTAEPVSPHREAGQAIRDAGGIPPGPWRVGGHCPRNLWVGPPRPHGVDVGRMDNDALAAHVVTAVNDHDRYRRALETIHAAAADTDDGPDRLPRSPAKQLRVIARAAAEALNPEEAQ